MDTNGNRFIQITDMDGGKEFFAKELSYKLVGCFYKVRNLYGSGHREKLYDTVLDEVLREAGLNFINKPRIELFSVTTGKAISYIVPDKLVENSIIIEIKAKPYTSPDDMGQVRQYLSITKYEILYLVNFCEFQFQPRRFIYTNDRKSFLINQH